MSPITTRREGAVLVVTSDNPPVNALGYEVRAGLMAAIEEAGSADDVRAVVIIGAGKTFFAGADIAEFGRAPKAPLLPTVIEAIEGCAKPVIAAIHGSALGGGLEVALACHYRVAAKTAKLGLPEVKLGLLPGAGGTQRLPRLIGVEEALTMVVTGEPVTADRALDLGLVDAMADERDLEAEAIALAGGAADAPFPRTSALQDKIRTVPTDLFDQFIAKHGRILKGADAPKACLAAVRAAVELPFAEGVAKERALFQQLLAGDQSKALQHMFFAERGAAKIDGVAGDLPLIAINKVGVLGAGTMGGGIAMNFLKAGVAVVIVEREQAALDRGVATIRKNFEASAKRGRMTDAQVQAAMALLTPTLLQTDLADCDLVIEAVFENMDVKKAVFESLDAIVKPGAILATNTSYLDINEMAGVTRRPEAVIGLHFFSPANVMQLLEVVRAARTSDTVLATCMALARRIGKKAVVAGVCHGFIGNRMLAVRQREANKMIMEGAMPWDVDRVLTDFGFPMGPFQMADLAGLDLGWKAEESRGETLRDGLCERGRRGQKTGKGFYDYDENRNRTPSAEVEALIKTFAAKSGKLQRRIDDQEILERLLYPMVNEAYLILEEKIAQRPADIDVVWVYGYGWPVTRGGPMFWASLVGLKAVVEGLQRHAAVLDDTFRLSVLLSQKAAL